MKWIKIKPHLYECSNCGKKLSTSYPPEFWIVCPWCKEKLDEEK